MLCYKWYKIHERSIIIWSYWISVLLVPGVVRWQGDALSKQLKVAYGGLPKMSKIEKWISMSVALCLRWENTFSWNPSFGHRLFMFLKRTIKIFFLAISNTDE
jgi:hypothetical protein